MLNRYTLDEYSDVEHIANTLCKKSDTRTIFDSMMSSVVGRLEFVL